MNKKLFLGMFAAAGMLLATSCSNDELDVVQSGNEAQVTFSLAAEGGIATRAISDGKSADLLYYAIFDADQELITTIATSDNGLLKKENAFPDGSKQDEVTVTLAKGQEYTAVFWAQDASCNAYTVTAETDGLKVAVNYEGDNNDETRDAFFKAETFKVTGNAKIDVELKRPFAQINVGVTDADWNAAVASGITISESKVVIKNAATSINLLDGTVSGEQAVEYDFAAIPTDPATLEVDVDADGTIEESEKYKYLSMSYILVNDENGGSNKTTLEADGLQFTFKSGGEDIVFDEGLHAVPVQRNWRTNILGKLLTGDIDFTIVINPIYDGDYNIIDGTETTNEIAPGVTVEGNTYRISSADGLKWLADVVNGTATVENGYTKAFAQSNFSGKTVVLTNDIDLANVDWTPISDGCKVGGDGLGQCFSGTFDGGNHTISNMTVEGQGYVGLFAKAVGTIKNVKMRNVSVEGTTFVGAVIGYIYGTVENCHVDGGNVIAKVLDKEDNNGNNVGGIVGFVGEGSGVVTGNSVKNLNVTAYRTVGGIAGRVLASTTVTNNILDNVAVVADMLQDGGETVDKAKAGQVVGDNMANADLSSNTVNNVTVSIWTPVEGTVSVTPNNISDIQFNENTTYRFLGTYSDEVKIQASKGCTQTFDGSGATFKNHIQFTANRIADGVNELDDERTGKYIFRKFETPNSIAFGACAVEDLVIEGCNAYMMYFNISNSVVNATSNTIVRPATAEESYKRYDGGTQKDIVQVYADNYVLNLNNNIIKDEKGSGNNIEIYGNYEQFQKNTPTWTNSITAKGNVISNTSTTTPLVKIYNDVTYAPVEYPADYEIKDAAKTLAKQLKTENTTSGGSCLLEIRCRATGKEDSNQQLNGDE